ncbi:MAG: hydrolase [Candidatus Micrarchaeota archaeon]
MDKLYENAETGCCPRFDPAPWNEKEIVWKDKLFLKDHVISFFHIPLNFGQVIVKNIELIKNAGALSPFPLMLSDENSLFGSDIYINVSKEVPRAKLEKISGTFLTKVFEGGYQNMGKWIKEMNEYVKSKNKSVKKLYFFYTMCPACAKHYGKSYTVLVAQV